MNFNLTKYQIKKLRLALHLATEWEESVLDAHRTKLSTVKGKSVYSIPGDFKEYTNSCVKNIAAFKKIYDLFGEVR